MNDPLVMITIYDRPRDYPAGYVVRRFLVTVQGLVPDVYLGVNVATLEAARALIPEGMICMPRDPNDDPVIVETWF